MKHLLPLLLLFMTAYAQNDLPTVGTEMPMSMLAEKTPLTIRTSFFAVDFQGGLKQRFEEDPDDKNSRLLRVIGFKMSASLPKCADFPEGGTVTIEQSDTDVNPKSRLRVIQKSPLTYEHIYELTFKMTIDAPKNGLPQEEILTTQDPMILTGTITEFPPRGDLYKLQNPVDLILPDGDNVIATIQQFPVKIGGKQ